MGISEDADSISRLINTMRQLPSDSPVADRKRGYNNYNTQKDHWLGWLDANSGTGTYPRKIGKGRDAQYVYNHIVEPKMLLWLMSTARLDPELISAAQHASNNVHTLPGKSAALRKHVP